MTAKKHASKNHHVKHSTNHKVKKKIVKSASKTVHKKKEVTVHIQIARPNVLRKDVLALTIDTIELIKHYKKYSETKKRKTELLNLLREEINAIKKLTKELVVQDLPMGMKEFENLPMFKKQREALQKIERLREQTEKKWMKEEARIEKDVLKGPHGSPEMGEQIIAPPPVPQQSLSLEPSKPRDKLESDLEALRAKMAQL